MYIPLLPYPGGMLGVVNPSYRTREACWVLLTCHNEARNVSQELAEQAALGPGDGNSDINPQSLIRYSRSNSATIGWPEW